MRFLFLDTSYQYCRLAYLTEKGCLFSKEEKAVQGMENLVFLFLEEFQQLFSKEDVDVLVVAKGPGSFTGLRIGLSIFKTLAYAWKKELLAFSTLEIHNALHITAENLPKLALMDARNERAFGRLNDPHKVYIYDKVQSLEDWKKEIQTLSLPSLAFTLESQKLLPNFVWAEGTDTLQHYDFFKLYAFFLDAYPHSEKNPFMQKAHYISPTQVERLQNLEIDLQENLEFI